MAIPRVKATYSLDVETVAALERLARRWGVPKSEALRRVIRSATDQLGTVPHPAIQALDALQQSVALTAERAAAWIETVTAERRAAADRIPR